MNSDIVDVLVRKRRSTKVPNAGVVKAEWRSKEAVMRVKKGVKSCVVLEMNKLCVVCRSWFQLVDNSSHTWLELSTSTSLD